MGTLILAASKGSSGSNYSFLLIIVALFGLMYFVMIRPQRNRQRKAAEAQREVGVGQRIRTTSGMYGRIVSGDDDDVVVEFAPGVQIKMMRRAIMGVVNEEQPDGVRETVPGAPGSETTTTDGRGA
jgi:preprotein translocase subunit YajC